MILGNFHQGQFVDATLAKNIGIFSNSRTEHFWRTKMWHRVHQQLMNSEPTFGAPHLGVINQSRISFLTMKI
jgi:hypothetical protein